MTAASGIMSAVSTRISTSLITVMPRTTSVTGPRAFSSVITAMVVAGDFATATSPNSSATASATRGSWPRRKSNRSRSMNTTAATNTNTMTSWVSVMVPMLRKRFRTEARRSSPPADRAIRLRAISSMTRSRVTLASLRIPRRSGPMITPSTR